MTREQLEEYRSKKEEITELKSRISNLKEDENMVDNDTILNYRSGFPVPENIVGMDTKKYWRTRDRLVDRLEKLEKECDEIEEFVENIEESITRRIFRMYYVDGMTQDKVAKELHMHRSGISKKISDYLQLSHKSQKKTL